MPRAKSKKTEDITGAQEPAFIVTTGDVRHNDTTQRFIKSHVMRNSHRERRLKRLAHKGGTRELAAVGTSSSQNAVSEEEEVEDDGVQRKGNEAGSDAQKLSHRTKQDKILGENITRQIKGYDPFNILPIISTPRTHQILFNSRAHTFRTSIYAGTRDFVLNLASTSASLTWTVLCVEAYMQAFPYRSFVPESAGYLQNAIACINSSISLRNSNFEDATIAAVTHFSNFEVMYGNPIGAAAHIDGLFTMVQLRGGLEHLHSNGVLRRWVIWSDLIAATRFETSPRFPQATLPPAARIHLSSFLQPSVSIPVLTPSKSLIAALEKVGCLNLLQSFKHIHELAFFLDETASLPVKKSEEILLEAKYHDRVSAAEYDIIILLNQHPESESSTDSVARIFLLAALLHVYACLRLTRSAVGIRISLSSRLHSALEALKNPPMKLWGELLWVCFLGATTCSLASRGWYITRIKQLCRFLGLTTWEEVSLVLKQGAWLEAGTWKACEDTFTDIRDTGI